MSPPTLSETLRGWWDFHLVLLMLEATDMRKANERMREALKARKRRRTRK